VELNKDNIILLYKIINMFKKRTALQLTDISVALLISPNKTKEICTMLIEANILKIISDEWDTGYMYILPGGTLP